VRRVEKREVRTAHEARIMGERTNVVDVKDILGSLLSESGIRGDVEFVTSFDSNVSSSERSRSNSWSFLFGGRRER